MKIHKKKIIFFTFFLLAIMAVAWFFYRQDLSSQFALAGAGDKTSGYAWSENVGWISSNCTNDSSCGTVDYGVTVDPYTNIFSGYAWSENVGWISFNEVNTPDNNFRSSCPSGCTTCSACYNHLDNKVYGWANILSLGSNGWIKLNGTWPNGVNLNTGNKQLRGWGWNGNDDGSGIGWVSFNCTNDSSCGTSNYSVWAGVNLPPSPTGMNAPNWSMNQACSTRRARQAFLRWTFTDTDTGSSQSAYKVIVDTHSDFSAPIVNTGKVSGSNNEYLLDDTVLAYNTVYYWEVVVWDEYGLYSATTTGPSFTTFKHEMPNISYSNAPSNPSVQQPIKFTDTSSVYGGATKSAWLWTATNASISATTSAATTIIFNSSSSQNTTLSVTDSDAYVCTSLPKTFDVKTSLPGWKEVK